jgi:hypothetical protein
VIYETILEARKEAYERDIFLNSEHKLKDILILSYNIDKSRLNKRRPD